MHASGVDLGDLARMGPERIGELLRAARRDRALSPDVVAGRAGVSRRDLKRWERGDARPSPEQLERVAGGLGMALDELIPPREPVAYHPATGTLTVGHRTAAIVRRADDHDGNAAVLRTYVAAVAASRGCPPATTFALRRDDIEVLAELLDLDDPELARRLEVLVGLSAADAVVARSRLLSRRAAAVATAATVAVLATGSLAAAAASGGGSGPTPAPTTTSPATTVSPPSTTVTTVTPSPTTAPDAPVVVTADTQPHAVSPVQLPDDADGDGIDIGSALVIERGTPPSDPNIQIGDTYTYER